MADQPDGLLAPSPADIDALARAALAALPQPFRALCRGVVLRVEELAGEDVLEALEAEDPFEITGLYDGPDLRGGAWSGDGPPTVTLFRRAILDEWAERGNVTLGELVRHVLVHEIAHHVGMSDEDIMALDDWTA